MATSTELYQPATGRAFVNLTSWAGDAAFTTTPVATDQIEAPDTLSLGVDGSVGGVDGTYTLRHIIASTGQVEAISYQIGTGTLAPQGTISLGSPTVDQTTASIPFTYNDTDQTGFEYRVDGGSWVSTNSPVTLSGLTANTEYTIEVQAVNAGGSGTSSSVVLTTDPIPSVASTTVPLAAPTGTTLATLEAGFDDYAFQELPEGEPAAGWQILTTVGYFDSQGNYWLDDGEAYGVSDMWFVDLNGVTYKETLDSTGLSAPLQGEITVGTVTVGRNSATIEFSYNAADADGFEYRLDGGAWTQVVSPIALSGLTAETPYQVDLRAYNSTTQSVFKSVNFTTDSAVDTTPTTFNFSAQTNVARSVMITSNAITVQGVDAGVDVVSSVSGDTGSQQSVSTDGGATWGGWSAADQNVRLNYRIRTRHTTSDQYSSGGYDGVRETTLTVGGVAAVFRSTTLADTTPPVITLTGGNINWTQGDPWVEPGYSAIDNADGDISVSGVEVIGTIDVNLLEPQQILYRATDASGNQSEAARTVTIVEATPDDQIAPVITLIGGNQTITEGDTWSEPGFSASDNVDGDLTAQVTVTGTVNTATPGSYTLTYSVTDAAGNTGTATRTVTVSDGSVVVEGEGLFRSLFSALEKPLFKPLFR